MSKEISVYKIEYELDHARWTASIAGYSKEECVAHLEKVVNKKVVVTSISKECRLDAISDTLRDMILKNTVKGEEEPKKERRKPGPKPKKKTLMGE